MASRRSRLIIVVRRPGVYRPGGPAGGLSRRTRVLPDGAGSVPGVGRDGSDVGRICVAASAKAALVPAGTMAVMACCLTAAAFRAFAAASSASADDPASEPFGPLSDAITTVSALVSMSGREAGSGPKTERLRFAALPAGGPPAPTSASAGAALPSAGARPSPGRASAAPDPDPEAAPVALVWP